MYSFEIGLIQDKLEEKAKELLGDINRFLKAVKNREESLNELTTDINTIFSATNNFDAHRITKEIHKQKHEEKALTHNISHLYLEIDSYAHILSKAKKGLSKTKKEFEKGNYLKKLKLLRKAEKHYYGRKSPLWKALEDYIDYVELREDKDTKKKFKDFEEAQQLAEEKKENIQGQLQHLHNIHAQIFTGAQELSTYLQNVIEHEYDYKPSLLLDLNTSEDTIIVDTSFISRIYEDINNYRSLHIHTKHKKILIPQSVKKELNKTNGKINGPFYNYFKKQFGAEEIAVKIPTEERKELAKLIANNTPQKKGYFSIKKIFSSADPEILYLAQQKHTPVLILTNDTDFIHVVTKDVRHFSNTSVKEYQNGKIKKV